MCLRLSDASFHDLSQRVRLTMGLTFGFHSSKAVLALVNAGPVHLTLPGRTRHDHLGQARGATIQSAPSSQHFGVRE